MSDWKIKGSDQSLVDILASTKQVKVENESSGEKRTVLVDSGAEGDKLSRDVGEKISNGNFHD